LVQTGPSYIKSYKSGNLTDAILSLREKSKNCTICPHLCKIDRYCNSSGYCNSAYLPKVASAGPHFGEEPPLTGIHGSGTIFLSSCNQSCIFCQNYDISQQDSGIEMGISELSRWMVKLQEQGCHNINFVTPTHMIAAIVEALPEAIDMGLSIPLVYNSGGYDSVDTLKSLEGIFDIYMPDLKYMDEKIGYDLSGVRDYPEIACNAIREMHRQVGDLQLDKYGIATRGLIVRHLILPENLAGTDKALEFIAELSKDTYLNLMDQYRPAFHADGDKRINRRISHNEYASAVALVKKYGLHRLTD